jgi:hypothetical protein
MDKGEKRTETAPPSCECGCPGQCKECRCKKKDAPERPNVIPFPVLTHMVWLLVLWVMG